MLYDKAFLQNVRLGSKSGNEDRTILAKPNELEKHADCIDITDKRIDGFKFCVLLL